MGRALMMTSLHLFWFVSVFSLASGQLCCGNAQSKCTMACAGKSCDLQCSSASSCCLLGNCPTCGPYTCRALTNACIESSSVTTTATTIAAVTTTTAAVTTTNAATTTTAAPTTTAGPCQVPGNAMCWNKNTGQITGDPCCDGSECLPWLGKSGVAGSSYCQFRDCLTAGALCNERKGVCCTGLTCTSGKCA